MNKGKPSKRNKDFVNVRTESKSPRRFAYKEKNRVCSVAWVVGNPREAIIVRDLRGLFCWNMEIVSIPLTLLFGPPSKDRPESQKAKQGWGVAQLSCRVEPGGL
ncbi:hypothetical protein ACJRO7_028044 [Eucalyptus globulus]|uniref:Uncharacterized protein n=1 Tax=Eucalyptus globulus TaxID=34317 RepID=A0ABD3K087_EUCGL